MSGIEKDTAEQDPSKGDKRGSNPIVSILGVSIPIWVAVITAAGGIAAAAYSQLVTAKINSATTIYCAQLDARKLYLHQRDTYYYAAMSAAGQVENASFPTYSSANVGSSDKQFQLVYDTEIRAVNAPGDPVERAAHAFSDCVIYLSTPAGSDRNGYEDDIINHIYPIKDYPSFHPLLEDYFQTDTNEARAKLFAFFEQNMDNVMIGAINSESDPGQYPNSNITSKL